MQQGVLRKRKTPPLSEYGRQLREKQDLKAQYNLREKQLRNYVKRVLSNKTKESSPDLLMRQLELRLDSIVFRMGLAKTRKEARQMASHGHFLLNGKRMTIPSAQLRVGDVITIRPQSGARILFTNAKIAMQKHENPSWIALDKEKMEAKVIGLPTAEEVAPAVELPIIFEFYSR